MGVGGFQTCPYCREYKLPNGVTVEGKDRFGEDSHGIQLVAQGTLASYELSSVGSVETVNAVHSQHSSLVLTNVVLFIPITSQPFVAR